MDIVEFEDWLDRLGEDVSGWPDPQRDEAKALLAQSADARALLDEARMLRGALAAPAVRAPAGLADRILAQASQTPAAAPAPSAAPKLAVENVVRAASRARWRLPLPIDYRSRAAVLLPLCFIVGLLIGLFSHPEEADLDQVDLPAYVAHVLDVAHGID
ncbi:MAG: hypothetical protein AB1586_02650 [Pseudomonadota bacterium]|jgi:hypothetical protein